VDPVPDPLLLKKSGSAGNRTRDLCICSQKLWPLDHRGGPIISNIIKNYFNGWNIQTNEYKKCLSFAVHECCIILFDLRNSEHENTVTFSVNSNLEILERFQWKVLRIITDAPWDMPNTIIKRDLQIPTVKQEARKCSANYRKRLDAHPNNLANALFQEQLGTCRLKRLYPADLVTNG